jgi:hypothetical protein
LLRILQKFFWICLMNSWKFNRNFVMLLRKFKSIFVRIPEKYKRLSVMMAL